MNEYLRALKSRLHDLDGRFRERTLRERAILGAGLAALLFMIVDTLAIRPTAEQLTRTDNANKQAISEIETLEAELAAFTNVELTEEERALVAELTQLKQQINQIDQRLSQEISALVPPNEIVGLLSEILADTPDLTLITLASRQPERVGSKSPEGSAEDLNLPGSALYRHGLRIELEGSFGAAQDYLTRLESLRWHLLWDRVDLTIQQYPTARITVDLHTISNEEEWVGV